jgi:hypothetical protein
LIAVVYLAAAAAIGLGIWRLRKWLLDEAPRPRGVVTPSPGPRPHQRLDAVTATAAIGAAVRWNGFPTRDAWRASKGYALAKKATQ